MDNEMDKNTDIEHTQEITEPSTQTTGGTKPLHRFLRGEPRAVGIVLLFLGVCLFAFGTLMTRVPWETSTDYYCPFWLGIMYFICGILYIQSERNTTKKIVTISFALSILAVLGTIVGAIMLIISIIILNRHSMYQYDFNDETDVDIDPYMQFYSLEAVFLFHSLVAGVILITMSVFARLSLRSSHTQMLVVMRYPQSTE